MNEIILTKITKFNATLEKKIVNVDVLGYESTCADVIYNLRTLIEHIATYHYGCSKKIEVNMDYDTIKNKVIPFIKQEKNLVSLAKMHLFIQASASHYVVDEETAPRLILKYLPYLISIKKWFKKTYDINILSNINLLYRIEDDELSEYYEKIYTLLEENNSNSTNFNKRYYIYKSVPIYVNNDIIYELTLIPASDYASKFNRFVAFSSFALKTNYSIKLNFIEKNITVKNFTIPIRIITSYLVSIRPCEFNNFAKLLDLDISIRSGLIEYKNLMNILTGEPITLVDIIGMSDSAFNSFVKNILYGAETHKLFDLFELIRSTISQNKYGKNVIKYLLYRMNNKTIKEQFFSPPNRQNLCIHNNTIPFDSNPLAMNLKNHQTILSDLIEIFDVHNMEYQLLYRTIRNQTEKGGKLYIDSKNLNYNDTIIDRHIEMMNRRLEWSPNSKIKKMNNKLYIEEYELTTRGIIDKLTELTKTGMQDYKIYAENIIESKKILIDSLEKRRIISALFDNSHLAIVYGPAGTGKSYLAKHISKLFDHNRKIYLAATHPAVNNLYRKIGESREKFMTVASYISKKIETDILFIDECSTVSNSDMLKILNENKFKYLVLLGDICQIHSIKYGPWFKFAKILLPNNSKYELLELHRTSSKNLEELWKLVRERDERIEEYLLQNDFVRNIDDDTLLANEADQIVLCLNYDGLYGINNINRLLQSKNDSVEYLINDYTYKENDPILFTENNQYSKILYNNLKGHIIKIEDKVTCVEFTLNVERIFNEFDLEDYFDIKLIRNNSDGTAIISLIVDKEIDSDYDESRCKLVPFQIAYAISIHKAQGLEYKTVKVVVCNSTFDKISHDIFYTAITRATDNLKIYWSERTEKEVIKNICIYPSTEDIEIFANKFKYKIRNKDFNK